MSGVGALHHVLCPAVIPEAFLWLRTSAAKLTSDKIVDLLAQADIHVTDDQAVAIERFVRDTGGLDQARSAVETLGQLITAA